MGAPGHRTEQPRIDPETAEGPGGVYVHIPFCLHKCPYCSFVSCDGASGSLRKSYVEALGRQLQDMAAHPWCRARKFHSIYIGGGTPTTVDIGAMTDFVTACLEAFDFAAASHGRPEVTIEVNPNSVNKAVLKRLKQAGINRLSIGVQSFSARLLKAIGRKHSVEECQQAFADARDAGFDNISVDLMYGLPGQDLDEWEYSLEMAVDLGPEHLSVYELTIEDGTPFADQARQKKLMLPGEEVVLAMFELTRKALAPNGYSHYEISNYCRKGFRSVHNVNYWENGSYVGLGSGAVSCFSGVRVQNEKDPQRFIDMVTGQRKPFVEAEFLSLNARFRETVIMGLRMLDGVSVSHLEKRYGMTPEEHYGETLKALLEQELLAAKPDRLHLTRRGILLANRVMAQLV